MSTRRCQIVFLFLLFLVPLAIRMPSQDPGSPGVPVPLRIEGSIVNLEMNALHYRLAPLTIEVSRWSTDEELLAAREVLRSGGQQALFDALSPRKPNGRFAISSACATEVLLARYFPSPDGGANILLITKDRIGLIEQEKQEFRFGAAHLVLDRRGKGEGTVGGAVRVIITDQGQFTYEAVGKYKLRLKDLRVIAPKK